MITRRRFVRSVSATSFALALEPGLPFAAAEPAPATYQNPILGGDHPDASPIRVGNDFYLTHSSFEYAPGLLIWHSLDLINWRPVAAALHKFYGSIWAPYLCEYQGHFYLYFPCNNRILVVHAQRPTGGITLGPEGFSVRLADGYAIPHPENKATRATLRIVNDHQEVDFPKGIFFSRAPIAAPPPIDENP